uniref:Heat shock factor binding protein 1b n=1 Tax=Oryzias latipes TaxID=8090 RepID=A0A3B3HVS7_ORYLA
WHQLQPRSPGSRTRKPADPAYQAELFLSGTLDQMGRRIKDLEKNVAELMSQAGMEASSDVSESI